MSNIRKAFENGKALIAFVTCGDPDLQTTAAVVREAAEKGADLIELGIPFSDPVAEGPVIQGANLRALQGGVTTDKIFSMVKQLRQDITTPMVFMTYANVVYSYGTERFLRACHDIGMDGLILTDVPFEEKEEFLPVCRRYGVNLISLIAPAPEKRIATIANEAEGFLYILPSTGITETGNEMKNDPASIVAVVRKHTDLPCAIRLSSTDLEHVQRMAAVADGVIVDSAIVKQIEQYGRNSAAHVGGYVKTMKDAMRDQK